MKIKQKRTQALLAVLALAALLAGCGKSGGFDASQYSITEPGTWTDGTYTESADGKNGEFTVTVVVSGGRMTEITVGDNSETPDKGGAAIEALPDRILEEQSVTVDAISGATVTSDAIKTAVAKCLEAASD